MHEILLIYTASASLGFDTLAFIELWFPPSAPCINTLAENTPSCFLNLGVVRIGTLYDFRRMEHRSGIADPTEGTKEVFHHIGNLFIADSEDPGARASLHMRALEEFHAVKISNSRNITFRNVGLSRKFNNPDCYLFCTSAVHSRATMAQFEGTDSCVEIIDVQGFYRLLTASLNALNPVVFVASTAFPTKLDQNRGMGATGEDTPP